jgi:hypothetical protein
VEHVQVRGLPRVDLAAESTQDGQVGGRVVCVGSGRAGGVLGSSKLPGTWNASQPPGARAATRPGSRSTWPGTHWSAAFETRTSTPPAAASDSEGRQPAMSPTVNSTPWPTGAAAIISWLESTPSTFAVGHRRARSTVRWPVPQPRSTTVRGASASMRETSSRNGRLRSSAKLR